MSVVSEDKNFMLVKPAQSPPQTPPQSDADKTYAVMGSVFHLILVIVAFVLQFRCNKAAPFLGSSIMCLCCPYLYLAWMLGRYVVYGQCSVPDT